MKTAARGAAAALALILGPRVVFAEPRGTDFSKASWSLIGDSDGIRVFRWAVPDSDVLAFRAEATVDAPVAKVASVLIDSKREPEWLPDLKEDRVLRRLSRTERIEYTHMGTPPVVKDRDFVLRGSAALDDEKRLVLSFHSVDDPAAPSTRYVRGEMRASSYTLWPTADGRGTRLIFVVHADPKGAVPKWIVNFFSSSYPRLAVEALRRQARRADVVDNEDVKAAFAKVLAGAAGLD